MPECLSAPMPELITDFSCYKENIDPITGSLPPTRPKRSKRLRMALREITPLASDGKKAKMKRSTSKKSQSKRNMSLTMKKLHDLNVSTGDGLDKGTGKGKGMGGRDTGGARQAEFMDQENSHPSHSSSNITVNSRLRSRCQ